MLRYFVFFIGLLGLLPVGISAQTFDQRGAVLDGSNRTRISGAAIQNIRSGEIRQSDLQGVFTIPVQAGDSIRISKTDYGPAIYTVQNASDTVIYLTRSITLRDVTVFGKSKATEMQEIMDDFRKKGTFYNGKPPALSFLASPITGLYELFGKTPRNAKRFQSFMTRELEASRVDQKFNKTLIVAVTGLSGEDLVNFMDLYRPGPDRVKTWSEYDARVYIENSFQDFERKGRPQAPKLPPLQ